MNSFDSTVSNVNTLSTQMKDAALTDHWDIFRNLDNKRQSMLRLLRYENYRDVVSVERFAASIETLLDVNKELVAIVEGHRDDAAVDLDKLRKNRKASNAYGQI